MFKIVRHFMRSNRKLTVRRVALECDAQAHCRNPETSYKTATSSTAKARTRKYGPWFDCYTECNR